MKFSVPLAALALLAALSARADESMDGMHHHHSMGMTAMDAREALSFPADMQTHMLRNMRDHVETLNGILHALAADDYDGAAKLAADRLGLDSPGAAGCKPKNADSPPPAQGSMDEMMALYMPEPMRAWGLALHKSASDFARIAKTGDRKETLQALSRVTQNCVACHAAYRLR